MLQEKSLLSRGCRGRSPAASPACCRIDMDLCLVFGRWSDNRRVRRWLDNGLIGRRVHDRRVRGLVFDRAAANEQAREGQSYGYENEFVDSHWLTQFGHEGQHNARLQQCQNGDEILCDSSLQLVHNGQAMSNTYPTLQHEWFNEVWNLGNEGAIDDLCVEDVVGHGLVDDTGETVRSREGFKQFFRSFKSAFPDIHVEVLDTVSEGDRIVALCKVDATHTGGGFLIEPTGRRVSFTGMCMVKVREGRIAESWNSFDFLTLVQQIDAVQLKS